MSSASFHPIAVVGRACILPGAASPAALWELVARGDDAIREAPKGRFRIDPRLVRVDGDDRTDRASTTRGGYVEGFVLDDTGLAISRDQLAPLDPLFSWLCHAGRDALVDAGFDLPLRGRRAGAVVGNLSFPTEGMTLWGEAAALGDELRSRVGRPWSAPHDPRNRFMSGLPAHLLARALRLDAGAFAIDAACASSLYAIHLAARALADGRADVMLAGAVNRADSLFLHIGFTALQALSPTGTPRPFDRRADGLVPAEGCVLVALMRLEDAVREGRRIHGVVRGAGLSNDGRARNLLAPSSEGQQRAIRSAWAAAGLPPGDVDFIECHATGTPTGDRTEVVTLSEAFASGRWIPIGSLKGNLGHLITAAGAAGLLKVLSALEHAQLPPSIHAEQPLDLLDGRLPFFVQDRLAAWPRPPDRPRRAGISAFGFGGNNAHIVVEEYADTRASVALPARRTEPIAIVEIVVRVADRDTDHVDVAVDGLRFPPHDLKQAIAQQLLMLEAARDVARSLPIDEIARERIGVFVGMGCDVSVTSPGLRWRAPLLARRLAPWLSGKDARRFVETLRDATPPLAAQTVLGCMPNIPANRISTQLDLRGPGFTVSAEEASGLAALDVARALLRAGEIDAALIGAVDAARDLRHAQALRALRDVGEMVDAAVALVVMKVERARSLGLPILALIDEDQQADEHLPSSLVRTRVGDAHAAEALLAVAEAASALAGRVRLDDARPMLQRRRAIAVTCDATGAAQARVTVSAADARGVVPRLRTFSARDRGALLEALRGKTVEPGPYRAAVVALDDGMLVARCKALAERLETAEHVDDDGMCARLASPVAPSELGLLFGTAGSVSPWQSRALLRAFPALGDALADLVGEERLESVLALTRHPPGCLGDLLAASAHMQLVAMLVRDVLRVRSGCAVGVSLGESNALFAAGAWRDLAAMLDDMESSRLFDELLFGSFSAARTWWNRAGHPELAQGDPWHAVTLRARVDDVRAACAQQDLAGLVFPLVIHAPDEVEVGGAPRALAELVRRLAVDAVPLPHMPAVHCPLLEPAADAYRRLHRRDVTTTDIKVYGHAACAPHILDDDAVADGLLAQGRATVDFPAMLRRLEDDGIRVLLDLSPRALCGAWARRCATRLHVVSFDGTPLDIAMAAARAWTLGVDVDLSALRGTDRVGATLRVPLHAKPPAVPTAPAAPHVMPPPPPLPPRTIVSAPASAQPPAVEEESKGVDLHTAHRAFLTAASEGHRAWLSSREASLARLASISRLEDRRNGVLWRRSDLEKLASGRIADVWGDLFAVQDAFRRQVRMPEPPLLLADRVLSIDATPGVLEKDRSVVTETDVVEGAWYLHENRCPAGVLIETGQADLLLVSYMGVDFENRGERVYRLLGCDLTYRSRLPLAGTTLRHDIQVDGYATHGDTRIFFFHSDTTNAQTTAPILSVRNGQAGFFTDEELANSGGVLWRPEDVALPPTQLAVPPRPTRKRALDESDLRAFSEGDVVACFGDGFEITRAHVRTPRIASGRLLLVDRVTELDVGGGPWHRGYLRAELDLHESSWFFAGHFKDDPCMPGTIMFEGCLQTLAIYLTACGFTLERDGFVFEPVVDKTFKLRCRGQATPSSRKLVYEVFVRDMRDGLEPIVDADILVTVDGLKSLHCEAVELKLACDWPLTTKPELVRDGSAVDAVAPPSDTPAVFDQRALLATGIGKPSEAFPGLYEPFDGGRRVPRLPGPPYHFMSRVTHVEGPPPGSLAHGMSPAGTTAFVEYDVPPDAWFFRESANGRMPFAVLLEIALQPCGWISSYVGSALTSDGELFYRNLDGRNALVHREVDRDIGTLVTKATLTKSSSSGGMIIQELDFAVSTADGAAVFAGSTTFGFFPPDALARQVGLPVSDAERARLRKHDGVVELSPVERGGLRLPGPMLLMLDRVTSHGPGHVCAEKRVRVDEWFFKAHFFQDPVQPGSLGLEAMQQALQWLAIRDDVGRGMRRPRFESVAVGAPLVWKYRGQVVPKNALIQVEMQNAQVSRDERGVLLVADGTLWVDGLKIYSADQFPLRVVDDDP